MFLGAGVYALYYAGPSPLYAPLASQNATGCNAPIYVGKAVPGGSRKGVAVQAAGPALYRRLREHAESIRQVQLYCPPASAGYLALKDCSYRFLVVDDVWIPLIESLSITSYKPPWNGFVDGFGHHDQGSTRRSQERSFWDSLHPGRPWALGFRENSVSREDIAAGLQRWWHDPRVRLTKGKRNQIQSDEA
ncbi:MAG: Eco29kI family restriction endonuclease [Chloroflexota bacterium]|nr:Eco29kI family restriction endonuclease [Chloroflexota bacterium]